MTTQLVENVKKFCRVFLIREETLLVRRCDESLAMLNRTGFFVISRVGYAFDHLNWRLICSGNKDDARATAEVLCSLGYMFLLEEKNGITLVSACKLSRVHIYMRCEVQNRQIILSRNDLVARMMYSEETVQSVDFIDCWKSKSEKHVEFWKYIFWKRRKGAFLLAKHYRNGQFFHVLKFLALFL